MQRRKTYLKKKSQLETKDNHERWLLTYADMITLLLGLFIILYSISNVDKKKLENVADAIRIGFGFGDRLRIAIFEGGSERLDEEIFKPRSPVYRLWERLGYNLKKWKESTLLKLGLREVEELKIILYAPIPEEGDWIVDSMQDEVYKNLSQLTKDMDIEIFLRLQIPTNQISKRGNWEESARITSKLAKLLETNYQIPPEKILIMAHTSFQLEPFASPENPEDLAKQERIEITIRKKK